MLLKRDSASFNSDHLDWKLLILSSCWWRSLNVCLAARWLTLLLVTAFAEHIYEPRNSLKKTLFLYFNASFGKQIQENVLLQSSHFNSKMKLKLKTYLSFLPSSHSFLPCLNSFAVFFRQRHTSTETDVNMRLAKAWTAINKLSVIWKSDLADKIKFSFFQAAVVLILLYGCTTWTLTKTGEKA